MVTSSDNNKKKVLIVDEESRLLEAMSMSLNLDGFDVATASHGFEAIEKIRKSPPDIITLDITLPDMDGFETLRMIRKISDMPVIMLTTKGQTFDKVKAISLGADDYITKPFDPSDLAARILAVIRRVKSWSVPDEIISAGEDLEINFKHNKVTVKGKDFHLRPTGCQLLYQLVKNAGIPISNRVLLKKIWGYEYEDMEQYLWPYITYLRQMIEVDPNNPKFILNKNGEGFKFQNLKLNH